MGDTKKSYSSDKYGRIQQVNYTEKRSDRKTETRHYTKYGEYTGKTVSNGKKSEGYDRSGSSTSGGGGCFLTTACVEYAGLPDDCYELQTMRKFRDEYVCKLPEAAMLIQDYYRAAPVIVERITSESNPSEVFQRLLSTLREVVMLIEKGQSSEALALSAIEFRHLKKRYGCE